jgi:hypothetical protein
MSTHLKQYMLILILVALSVSGFLWWQTVQKKASQPTEGLGSKLYQKTENPADNLPAVNPLENKPAVNPLSGSNPFTDIKTNPFR